MTPARLIELASRHQVHLERLKSGLARDFVATIGRIDKVVLQALTELGVSSLSDIARKRLESVLTSLEAAQARVFAEAVNALVPKLESLADYEATYEANSIKDVLTKAGKKRIKLPTAKKAFKEALARPIQATGEKLEPFVDNWSKRAIQKVNGAIRVGYQQGKTVPEIVKAVRGTKAARFKDGIVAVTRREAEAVVHTSVQHTASTARFVTWEENADVVVGYEWVATLDSKTTVKCRSLDGKVFSVGKGPVPPIHIRCRSTTAASLDDEFDFLDEGATRSSTDGYVAADLSYYDWLKKQPASFQDSVLGKTRGTLFRDGGLSAKRFGDLQLDRNFEPLTLGEMRALEPVAFQRAGI